MRKYLGCLLSIAILFSTSGCIAVNAKDNTFGNERQAVAMGDRILIVNVSTGEVSEIDASKIEQFKPCEKEETD